MSATLALARQSFDPRVIGAMHMWLSGEINGNAGNTWTDLSGSGNNGTLTNGPTFSSTGGGSISLDGVNDYVATGVTSTTVGNAWSIGIWFRPTGAQSTTGIYALQGSANNGSPLVLFQRQNSTTVRYYLNFGYRISQTANDSVWTHFVLTYDGTIFRAYKNGSADGTYTATVSIVGTDRTFWFGNGFNGYAAGLFGDVAIWKTALSADAISAVYERSRFRYA